MAGEGTVLTCALITLASTTGSDLRQGNLLDPKKIVGGFLAMTTCAIAAEVDAEIGVGLAVAIAGTAFVKFGLPAILNPVQPGASTLTPGSAQWKAGVQSAQKRVPGAKGYKPDTASWLASSIYPVNPKTGAQAK